jgi:hypothetical protein
LKRLGGDIYRAPRSRGDEKQRPRHARMSAAAAVLREPYAREA